jgi:hypothetical protein
MRFSGLARKPSLRRAIALVEVAGCDVLDEREAALVESACERSQVEGRDARFAGAARPAFLTRATSWNPIEPLDRDGQSNTSSLPEPRWRDLRERGKAGLDGQIHAHAHPGDERGRAESSEVRASATASPSLEVDRGELDALERTPSARRPARLTAWLAG